MKPNTITLNQTHFETRIYTDWWLDPWQYLKCIRVYICMLMHLCMCEYCTQAHKHICIYIYTHMDTCIFIYVYIIIYYNHNIHLSSTYASTPPSFTPPIVPRCQSRTGPEGRGILFGRHQSHQGPAAAAALVDVPQRWGVEKPRGTRKTMGKP